MCPESPGRRCVGQKMMLVMLDASADVDKPFGGDFLLDFFLLLLLTLEAMVVLLTATSCSTTWTSISSFSSSIVIWQRTFCMRSISAPEVLFADI